MIFISVAPSPVIRFELLRRHKMILLYEADDEGFFSVQRVVCVCGDRGCFEVSNDRQIAARVNERGQRGMMATQGELWPTALARHTDSRRRGQNTNTEPTQEYVQTHAWTHITGYCHFIFSNYSILIILRNAKYCCDT